MSKTVKYQIVRRALSTVLKYNFFVAYPPPIPSCHGLAMQQQQQLTWLTTTTTATEGTMTNDTRLNKQCKHNAKTAHVIMDAIAMI